MSRSRYRKRVVSKAQSKENLETALKIIGTVLVIPLVVFAWLEHWRLLIAQQASSDSALRIQDSQLVLRSVVLCGIVAAVAVWVSVGFAGAHWAELSPASRVALLALASLVLLQMIRYLAARMFGVLVHVGADRISFPNGLSNFSLVEWVSLVPVWSFASVGSVSLSTIDRITRERGVRLHLHGPFGSRCVTLASKQKRDECIMAIEHASGRRLAGRDLGY